MSFFEWIFAGLAVAIGWAALPFVIVGVLCVVFFAIEHWRVTLLVVLAFAVVSLAGCSSLTCDAEAQRIAATRVCMEVPNCQMTPLSFEQLLHDTQDYALNCPAPVAPPRVSDSDEGVTRL